MKAAQTTGFRVTARDLEMVRWIGRLRFAEASQVARRFRMNERNTYRRLRGLVAHELLAHRRVFHGQPGAYSATPAGLVAARIRLPRPRLDIRTYTHDRVAAAMTIELEQEFGWDAIRTERELRSYDVGDPATPRYAVRRGYDLGRQGLHFPDLAVELDEAKPLAVEIELTAKGTRRLDSIVRAFVLGAHLDRVRYYAAPAALAGVTRAVDRAEAHWLFDVRALDERRVWGRG